MSPFRLACLTYLSVALPGSTLGVLWPSIRLDLHEPVGALGVILVASVVSTVVAGAVTSQLVGRLPVGLFITAGTALTAVGLGVEVSVSSLWAFTAGSLLYGIGFGAINSALNAHAAHSFGPRNITWMHASYGLGAIAGPLLVTGLLGSGLTWRDVYLIFAVVQAVVAVVLVRGRWDRPTVTREGGRAVLGVLVLVTVETGIEAGAGVWGYLFLTDGRGLSPSTAGLVVSAYWAMMFLGRMFLGALAERVGARVVLGWAVVGVALGAALLLVPGSTAAVAALMVIGFAAAPVFPLLALTSGTSMRAVGWQAVASSVGGSLLPAGMGLAIDATHVTVLGPLLLTLSVAMCLLSFRLRPSN